LIKNYFLFEILTTSFLSFSCTRVYWSAFEIGKKVLYKCKIKRANLNEKQQNDYTISHENPIIKSEFNNILQTDGNSDYFIDGENQTDKSTLTISAAAAVAATSTVTLTSIGTANTKLNQVEKPATNLGKFLYNSKNQTLLKIFSTPAITPSIETSTTTTSLSTTNIKPKVLKLSNDYNKSLTQTPSIIPNTRIDKSGIRNESILYIPTSSSNSNFIQKQQLNVDTSSNMCSRLTNRLESNDDNVSPKSDKSDSSLNLDFSSIINNPLITSCYGDEEIHQQQQQQQPQLHQYKIEPELNDKKSKRCKSKQNINGDMNFDYNEYHTEKQNLLNKNKNSLNSKTVITKCSKVRSQHTIKQLLDNFENLNKKTESETKLRDYPVSPSKSVSSTTSTTTPTSSLALLLNSKRAVPRQIHDLPELMSFSETQISSSMSPSSVSSNSLNIKMNKTGVKSTKRKCNEILSENESLNNNNNNIVDDYDSFNSRFVLGELNDNIFIDQNELNDCDLLFEITSEDGLFIQSKDINGIFFFFFMSFLSFLKFLSLK
jgi:hypothetical protein